MIVDDGYVGGPPHILFPAILRFEQQIREECNLTLQRSKCEVYTQSGDLPEDALPGFIKAGEEVDGVFLPGFMCVGAPLGSDEYVAHMMRQKVGELREEVEATVELLAEEKQALWTCLRASLSHKLEYWLGLLYPSQAEEAAREVDKLHREVVEKVVGSHLPHQPGLLTCPCCITVEGLEVNIPGLEGHTYQSLTLQLPLKLGGMGLRSQLFVSPLAYYGAIEQSLPHFSTVCPALKHLYGEEEGEDQR